jgi:hypothetical protein
MMSIEVRIPVIAGGPPPEVHPELLRLTAAALGIAAADLGTVVVRHRALDARKRRAHASHRTCGASDTRKSGTTLRAGARRETRAPRIVPC